MKEQRKTKILLVGAVFALGIPAAAAASGAAPAGPQLVVYGAGVSGLAAAVTAAQQGLRTVLVADDATPGGLVAHGWLTTWDLSRAPGGGLLTQGVFSRWMQALGGHDSFDLPTALRFFRHLAFDTPGLTTLTGCSLQSVQAAAGTVQRIALQCQGKPVTLQAPLFIDASGNANLAAQAGAPMDVGFHGTGLGNAHQAATLIFRLQGVDWPQVLAHVHRGTRYLQDHPGPRYSAWGYSFLVTQFRSPVPDTTLRGLNLALQADGSVLVSAVWVFGVDPMNPASLRRGWELGKQVIPYVVAYLRAHAAGFRHARLAGIAPALYVRQSRQTVAERTLTVTDELTNKMFWDRIVLASYPVDVQALAPGQHGFAVGTPVAYSIPFRALIPKGFQNLLVVGRSAGYTPIAAASARTLPVGIDEGQAAGDAAFLAAQRGENFAQLSARPGDVQALQALLVRQGADLTPPPGLPHALPVPAYVAPAMHFLLSHLLIAGGYHNRWFSDTTPTARWFAELLLNVLSRLHRLPDHRAYTLPPHGVLLTTAWAQALLAQAASAGDIPWSLSAVRGVPLPAAGLVHQDQAFALAYCLVRASRQPQVAEDPTAQGRSQSVLQTGP